MVRGIAIFAFLICTNVVYGSCWTRLGDMIADPREVFFLGARSIVQVFPLSPTIRPAKFERLSKQLPNGKAFIVSFNEKFWAVGTNKKVYLIEAYRDPTTEKKCPYRKVVRSFLWVGAKKPTRKFWRWTWGASLVKADDLEMILEASVRETQEKNFSTSLPDGPLETIGKSEPRFFPRSTLSQKLRFLPLVSAGVLFLTTPIVWEKWGWVGPWAPLPYLLHGQFVEKHADIVEHEWEALTILRDAEVILLGLPKPDWPCVTCQRAYGTGGWRELQKHSLRATRLAEFVKDPNKVEHWFQELGKISNPLPLLPASVMQEILSDEEIWRKYSQVPAVNPKIVARILQLIRNNSDDYSEDDLFHFIRYLRNSEGWRKSPHLQKWFARLPELTIEELIQIGKIESPMEDFTQAYVESRIKKERQKFP